MTTPSIVPHLARTPRPLLLALLLASAPSCAGRARNPFDTTSPQAGDRIRVEVQNLNFNDATVWAMRQSQRVRLGRVTGKTDQTFTIEWNTAVPIWFEVDIVSARSCSTGAVSVDPESRVFLIIPSEVGLQACQIGRR